MRSNELGCSPSSVCGLHVTSMRVLVGFADQFALGFDHHLIEARQGVLWRVHSREHRIRQIFGQNALE